MNHLVDLFSNFADRFLPVLKDGKWQDQHFLNDMLAKQCPMYRYE